MTIQEECNDVRHVHHHGGSPQRRSKDHRVRVVLWHGAGDSFCAGNDLEDFLKNPMGLGDSPQSRLINALINFEKPIVAAVHGFDIGGGTTMLTHCDFVYASESAKFRMPFINLALVPEFGSSYSIPARIGYLRAAELIQLGQGKGFAVLQTGSGFSAWLAWAAVHLQFLATSSLRVSVFVQWVWTYITGQRGSRLIVNHHGSDKETRSAETSLGVAATSK